LSKWNPQKFYLGIPSYFPKTVHEKICCVHEKNHPPGGTILLVWGALLNLDGNNTPLVRALIFFRQGAGANVKVTYTNDKQALIGYCLELFHR
jgi:hypothetical protein